MYISFTLKTLNRKLHILVYISFMAVRIAATEVIDAPTKGNSFNCLYTVSLFTKMGINLSERPGI